MEPTPSPHIADEPTINSKPSDFIILAEGQTSQYFIHQLHQRLPHSTIKVFVKQAKFQAPSEIEKLAGLTGNDLLSPEEWQKTAANSKITLYWDSWPKAIQADAHTILAKDNTKHVYEKLIIANDAIPKKLAIQNLENDNVLLLGNNNTIGQFLENTQQAKKIVIIGGGLFGIETARLLTEKHHQVVCIEQNSRILFEHLDDHASAYLVDHLENQNLHIKIQERVTAIHHHAAGSSVQLSNGERIECDYIVLATGAKPDTQIAIASGIRIDRGIVVNDYLETNQHDIYAIGENIEHRGKINRLLMSGAEQASILSNRFCGTDSSYVGSLSFSQFNILGYPVLSMGENGDYAADHQQLIFRDTRHKVYRKIILNKNRITGVIGLGHWEKADCVIDALRYNKRILPWQLQRFKSHGEISKKTITEKNSNKPDLDRVVSHYLPDHLIAKSDAQKSPFAFLNHWMIWVISLSTALAVYLLLPPIP